MDSHNIVMSTSEKFSEAAHTLRRQLTHLVQTEEAGMRLDDCLKQSFGLTRRQISHAKFLADGICVDGTPRRTTYRVQAGERLTIKIAEDANPAGDGSPAILSPGGDALRDCAPDPWVPAADALHDAVPDPWAPAADALHDTIPDPCLCILYEDEDVIAVDKPSGIVCHPSHGHQTDALSTFVQEHGRARGEAYAVRCIGRLDKDTSGIMLYAKHTYAASRLFRQRESGDLKKTYLALVHGSFPEDAASGKICLPMEADPADRRKMRTAHSGPVRMTLVEQGAVWQSAEPDGRPALTAVTCYEVVCPAPPVGTIVRLRLLTGRTHQIRLHMASIGHPLFGDPLYGRADGGRRAALHAEELRFLSTVTGELRVLHSFRNHMFD